MKPDTQTSIPQYVTKEANIGEIVGLYPVAADIMLEYGLHCAHCFAAGYDTVGEGARLHGMIDSEIDEMMDRINAVIHEQKQSTS